MNSRERRWFERGYEQSQHDMYIAQESGDGGFDGIRHEVECSICEKKLSDDFWRDMILRTRPKEGVE